MRGGRGVLATLTLALAVACTSSTNAAAGVAAYAEGRWACSLSDPMGSPVSVTAVVSVDDDSAGRVRIGLPMPGGGRRRLAGSWRLDGGELTVRWHPGRTPIDSSVGPTYGRGLALDSRRVRIRGEVRGVPGSGNWIPVSVDRRARSVTFRIPHDTLVPSRLTCRKA